LHAVLCHAVLCYDVLCCTEARTHLGCLVSLDCCRPHNRARCLHAAERALRPCATQLRKIPARHGECCHLGRLLVTSCNRVIGFVSVTNRCEWGSGVHRISLFSGLLHADHGAELRGHRAPGAAGGCCLLLHGMGKAAMLPVQRTLPCAGLCRQPTHCIERAPLKAAALLTCNAWAATFPGRLCGSVHCTQEGADPCPPSHPCSWCGATTASTSTSASTSRAADCGRRSSPSW